MNLTYAVWRLRFPTAVLLDLIQSTVWINVQARATQIYYPIDTNPIFEQIPRLFSRLSGNSYVKLGPARHSVCCIVFFKWKFFFELIEIPISKAFWRNESYKCPFISQTFHPKWEFMRLKCNSPFRELQSNFPPWTDSVKCNFDEVHSCALSSKFIGRLFHANSSEFSIKMERYAYINKSICKWFQREFYASEVNRFILDCFANLFCLHYIYSAAYEFWSVILTICKRLNELISQCLISSFQWTKPDRTIEMRLENQL